MIRNRFIVGDLPELLVDSTWMDDLSPHDLEEDDDGYADALTEEVPVVASSSSFSTAAGSWVAR